MESHSSTQPKEANNVQLQSEIRSMITTLTKHLTDLNRLRPHAEDDDQGFKIVTLAGTNKGSVVQADIEELARDTDHGVVFGGEEKVFAFANSNYQAVNNSVMLGGSYRAEDPGVHLNMSEYIDNHGSEITEKGTTEEEEKEEEEKEKEKMTRNEPSKLEEKFDDVFNPPL